MDSKPILKVATKNQISAVEQYGVVDDVLKLYKEGTPASKISVWLLENKKVKISNVSISKWLKKNKDLMQTKVATELQSFHKFESMCVNYEKEIKDILDEIKEVKDMAKDAKEVDQYVKLVGKLFQGLELLAKLMGDIKPSGSVDINIIVNKISELSLDQHKDSRKSLYTPSMIDVEAEILDADSEREQELNTGDE